MKQIWLRHLARVSGCALLVVAGPASAAVKFNRDIRPIMSDTCFRCHGPDPKSRMAGLRLDLPEEALKKTKSGVIPIVPGDPDQSAIVQRVFATNAAKLMPPKYAHKELTEKQKATIRQWVAEGAKYEGHWSYQAVKRPSVPAKAGTTHPVDAFVQARLAEENLAPSAEADKRTLLRRIFLDLTGLPPSPKDVEEFTQQTDPKAYEKVVDRLLSSPAYAEMQTMRWLDAVRYADSAGFHGDNLWPVWPYRDYVLRAFRDNKPFDVFTREQIAGDLMEGEALDPKIASAYNRLNRSSAEGGIQPKEYLAKYGADRVRTVSTVWMGATMGCAECHDHKFDPFSAKDFYSMKAFFADVKETGMIRDRGSEAWGSKLFLPDEKQQTRLAELNGAIAAKRKAMDQMAKDMAEQRWAWETRILEDQKAGKLAWKYQLPTRASSANGSTLTIAGDQPVESVFYLRGSLASEKRKAPGLVMASGPNPDNDTYTVEFKPGAGEWTAVGIDIWQDESLSGSRLARGADRFIVSELEALVNGTAVPLVFATSFGVGELPEEAAMAAIDGKADTGWAVSYGEARNPFLALRFSEPLKTTAESIVTVRLRQESSLRSATIGRFRVALSSGLNSWPENGDSAAKHTSAKDASGKDTNELCTLAVPTDDGLPPDLLQALEVSEEDRTGEQQGLAVHYWLRMAPETQQAAIDLAKLELDRDLLLASIPRVMTTVAARPRITRVLSRGNFLDDSGEIVEPAIPGFLGKLPKGEKRATRLDLANWLATAENPFTSRVYANRAWKQLFGTGLSRVLEDLGSQGELPTHPELLDWLAAEFVQPTWQAEGSHAWDMKHLVRTIVTSQTYKQSSLTNSELESKDPENRLLARQSRFRVDAEIVHDLALSVSGLLAERFGGPSVKPVQPAGYLSAMNFPKREYSASQGDDLHRRALYTQWLRTFLHPSLLTFDAPTREECSVNRSNSNTPLQALELLNDPIFVEAAGAFAMKALTEQPKAKKGERIEWVFQQALGRAPSKAEEKILLQLYEANAKAYRQDAKSASEAVRAYLPNTATKSPAEIPDMAALISVTRAVLNLHETITRN